MFQGQGMILKRGVTVGHSRVTCITGFRNKTKIRHVQAPQLLQLISRMLSGITGMQGQQQEDRQACCRKQQK